ncbi:hypothetical protein EW146_g2013 [Bondarzewia mesenterica]|uniref:GH16 domain-containing protein n=1 Tax=Bondarzewia mesenterica TaxID=1095465 RepID=A0A4S4M3J4_9AGAM|nr:hypothetical protein EW146_g2013 [Bondarzewia mesenterica]
MSIYEPGSKAAPVQITEDEAALYDRQIRLWGLEAQQRMRNATILMVNLRGVATETIKNIVLAGIGKLIIVDGEDVSEEDLGANFFFRDEDVGHKRVSAAKARIESLNPLVTVEVIPTTSVLERDELDGLVQGVDLVCVTDWTRDRFISVNEVCRRLHKPLYFGGTYGLLGYIFCDLLSHGFIAPDRSGSNKDPAKNVLATLNYSPLNEALKYRWSGLTRRQTKELNPTIPFTIFAIWEFQSRHGGNLPDSPVDADELEAIANTLLSEADVNKQILPAISRDFIETIATTAAHEFAPVCAVVGGMLAQDILKALSAREAPLANFFVFDGNTGGASESIEEDHMGILYLQPSSTAWVTTDITEHSEFAILFSHRPSMANSSRRAPPAASSQYYAVPQSPPSRSGSGTHNQQPYAGSSHPVRSGSSSSQAHFMQPTGRNGDVAQGVMSGSIGASYGPYAYNPSARDNGMYTASRFSAAPSEISSGTTGEKPAHMVSSSTVPPYLWDTKDPDLDDALHNPDPVRDAKLDRSFTLLSARGWANVGVLVILIAGLITLFAGYPIIVVYSRTELQTLGQNFGGSNGSGQIPSFPNLPQLIDQDTDQSVYTKTGTDGKTYNLVFSDEFNTDGRTFWPGDDPFWEAVNFNYWPTGDLEWYDPQAITTKNGKLVITVTEQNTHDLNFQSGMLQSWNKFCFTTGILEMSISLPGTPESPGFWPGLWPYSYAACDLGTFPKQMNKDGATPQGALTGSPEGGQISGLPGQRLSACTCPGSDHPGPNVGTGRSAPEIDLLEAQVDVSVFRGQASQSLQVAPFNYQYTFDNSSSSTPIQNPSITKFNSYKGGPLQQAISALTYLDPQYYNGSGFQPYAMEWWSNPSSRNEGYVTWSVNGQQTWTASAATLAGDTQTQISSRIVPEEPMSIVLNLGISPSFQQQDFKHMVFPNHMLIDYVRVYQRADVKNGVGCDPSSHPTADYIQNHLNAYSNANLTTWAQAGYTFPRNSKYDGC